MNPWHHGRSGWGRGRDFAGRPSPKQKGKNNIPERLHLKDTFPPLYSTEIVDGKLAYIVSMLTRQEVSFRDFPVSIQVDRLSPSGTADAWNSFHCFQSSFTKKFEKKLDPEEYFSPVDLFTKIQEQNEELGLIIDLTYTQRYYKPEEFPETISYIKIFTVGHQIPDDDTILKFKCAVNDFLKENKDNDKLIGVHCTHGLNRTGYLICRYLIDVEGMRPDDAIELFNRCRGHCIERQNYIKDLQNRHVRKNWHSGMSRPGFENSAQLMDRVHSTKRSVNQGPRNNRACGNLPPSRRFHTQTQNGQQSFRKCSQNQSAYQRGHIPPPGPVGEDYSQRRYFWNVKPNSSQTPQNKKLCPGSYQRFSYPTYWGWTK